MRGRELTAQHRMMNGRDFWVPFLYYDIWVTSSRPSFFEISASLARSATDGSSFYKRDGFA